MTSTQDNHPEIGIRPIYYGRDLMLLTGARPMAATSVEVTILSASRR